ncbi:MAG: 4-hydroxy-tetrahydrodipicolinate reductase [Candidatus Omnitrophota bacterium]
MVKIAVTGALGRMGSRILHLARCSSDFKITAAFEHAKCEQLGRDIGPLIGFGQPVGIKLQTLSLRAIAGADTVIDFSTPESTARCLEFCVKVKRALVIGTTGLDAPLRQQIEAAAKKIPVLAAPNMSIGANFLFELARIASARLKEGYDIEIVETHHRLKKDAPSGTAKRLAEVMARQKGWDLAKVGCYGRQGDTGQRPNEQIGIHAVRAGDVIGDHTVLFGGPGEVIELTHRAQSRDAFARGALVAAVFLSKKTKGLYQMADVLKI